MVMALFMVMFMMNPAGLNPMLMVHQHRLAAVSGFAVFAALTTAVLLSDLPHDPVAPGPPVIHDLGLELLGDSTLAFENAGVTLLAALIGPVVPSRRRAPYGPAEEGQQPPPPGPGRSPPPP